MQFFHSKRLWWDLTFQKKKCTGNYLIKDLINPRKLEVPGLAAAGGLYADFKNATF